MTDVIISVDPGIYGGWAKFKRNVLIEVGYGVVTPLDLYNVERLVIEDCRLISTGKKAISSLATQIGYCIGLSVALDINYSLVKPKDWQAHYGMERCTKSKIKRGVCDKEETYTAYKKRLLELAVNLYPEHSIDLKVCDAILLGGYYTSQGLYL